MDLKSGDTSELEKEILKLSKRYGIFPDNDSPTAESITETYDGRVEIIFTVSGEYGRKIKVEVIDCCAVYIYDGAEIIHRDVRY